MWRALHLFILLLMFGSPSASPPEPTPEPTTENCMQTEIVDCQQEATRELGCACLFDIDTTSCSTAAAGDIDEYRRGVCPDPTSQPTASPTPEPTSTSPTSSPTRFMCPDEREYVADNSCQACPPGMYADGTATRCASKRTVSVSSSNYTCGQVKAAWLDTAKGSCCRETAANFTLLGGSGTCVVVHDATTCFLHTQASPGCSVGEYTTDCSFPVDCAACPSGFYSGSTQLLQCTACDAGHWSGEGQGACSSFAHCPAGQFFTTGSSTADATCSALCLFISRA